MHPLLCSSCLRIAGATTVALTLLVGEASAQFSKGRPKLPSAPDSAAGQIQAASGVGQSAGQISPAQAREIYWLRTLQSRPRSNVRTGVPQFIPFGNPSSLNAPWFTQQNAQPQGTKTSAQKRAEARAAREERKRAAREKLKAKREAAERAKEEARAKARARQKPKDPTP